MRKTTLYLVFSVLAVYLVSGCAANKSFSRKDPALPSPIKIARHETPCILRTTMTESFIITGAAVALPGGSAQMLLSDEYAKARGGDMQQKIPDFGSLVMEKFVGQINEKAPELPTIIIVDTPIAEIDAEQSVMLEFKVKRLSYGYLGPLKGNGLQTSTLVTLKDPGGDVLWQKSFTYLSKDFSRDKGIEDYEADDGKLLREELEFAAEKTVSDFFEHLINGEKLEKAEQTEKESLESI